MRYRFGPCELDVQKRELRRSGTLVKIEPQVFDLLSMMLESGGRVVTKDEIFQAVWNGRAASESVLTTRIRSLRRAIGDNGRSPETILTLHRVGYRFAGDVERLDETDGTETADAEEEPVQSFAERRRIAVLAASDAGSEIAEDDPELVEARLARLRTAIESRMRESAGRLIESADGSLFAVFGFDSTHEDDASRAALLGLDLLNADEIDDIQLSLAATVGTAVSARRRIGGSALKSAARLAISAPNRRLAISPAFAAELPASAQIGRQGNLQVLEQLDGPGTAMRLEPRMVGRMAELTALVAAFSALVDGESGQTVLVHGEPGAGKSRLVRAAAEEIKRRGGFTAVIEFQELATDTGLLEHKIAKALAPLLPPSGMLVDDTEPLLRPVLEWLIGTGGGGQAATDQSTFDERGIAEAALTLLAAAASRQPVFLVLEGTHWIDPASARLVEAIADRLQEHAILLVATERPNQARLSTTLQHRADITLLKLSLSPLARRAALRLVDAVAPQLDEATRDHVVERSGGNPLFLLRLAEAARVGGSNAVNDAPSSVLGLVQANWTSCPRNCAPTCRGSRFLARRPSLRMCSKSFPTSTSGRWPRQASFRSAPSGYASITHSSATASTRRLRCQNAGPCMSSLRRGC